MKYYLLLAISLPLLSSEQSNEYSKPSFNDILEDANVNQILRALPNISEKNLQKEELAEARLELLIAHIHEGIFLEKKIVAALDTQAKFAKLTGNTKEYCELDIKQAQHQYRVEKFEAYLGSISKIRNEIQKRIKTYEEQQEPFDGIKFNFVPFKADSVKK